MKSDELMIGDWVLVKSIDYVEGMIRYVEEKTRVNFDILSRLEKQETKVFRDDCIYAIQVEPIPISAEILKKNGFEYSDKHGYFWESNYFSVTLKKISPYYWKIDIEWDDDRISTQMAVGYVHELQHALKIGTTNINIEL